MRPSYFEVIESNVQSGMRFTRGQGTFGTGVDTHPTARQFTTRGMVDPIPFVRGGSGTFGQGGTGHTYVSDQCMPEKNDPDPSTVTLGITDSKGNIFLNPDAGAYTVIHEAIHGILSVIEVPEDLRQKILTDLATKTVTLKTKGQETQILSFEEFLDVAPRGAVDLVVEETIAYHATATLTRMSVLDDLPSEARDKILERPLGIEELATYRSVEYGIDTALSRDTADAIAQLFNLPPTTPKEQ